MRAVDSFNSLLIVNWDSIDWFHPICSEKSETKQWTTISQDSATEKIYKNLCANSSLIGIDFHKIDDSLIKQSIKLSFVLKNSKNRTKNECPSFEDFLMSCLSYITPQTKDEQTVYFQIGNSLYKYRNLSIQ